MADKKSSDVLGPQTSARKGARPIPPATRKPVDVKIADSKKVRASLDKVRKRDRELLKRLAR